MKALMLIIALVFNANVLFFVCFIQFFRRIRMENGVFLQEQVMERQEDKFLFLC